MGKHFHYLCWLRAMRDETSYAKGVKDLTDKAFPVAKAKPA